MSHTANRLTLHQNGSGYRYNRDSFLLADFFNDPNHRHIADFCSGTGVVSILIGMHCPKLKITAIEIDPDSCLISWQNANASGLINYNAITADIMTAANMIKENSFDAIVANPPYRKAGSGRLNPDPKKAMARHEIKMNLNGMIDVASKLLKQGGSLYFIMIQERKEESLLTLEKYGFSIARIRYVKSFDDSEPNLFMVEAKLNINSETIVEPDLILKNESGCDSEMFERIMDKYVH